MQERPPNGSGNGNGNARLTRFRLGEFMVDANARTLTRAGETTVLTPRTMDVLEFLALHAGDTVANQVLLDTYWRGAFSSTNGIHKCVAELRQALGDDHAEPQYIETVPREGYRLVAPAEPLATEGNGNGHARILTSAADNERPAYASSTDDHLDSAPATRLTLVRRAAVAAAFVLALGAIVSFTLAPTDTDAHAPSTVAVSTTAARTLVPAGTSNVAPVQSQPRKLRIAILDIDGAAGADAAKARALRNALLATMAQSDRLSLIDAAYGATRLASAEVVRASAATLRADYVIGGRVNNTTGGVHVQLALYRGGDGVRLYHFDRKVQGASATLGNEVGAAMLVATEVLTDPGSAKAMESLRTNSPEAFVTFQDALSARSYREQAGVRRALAGYREAIAIDPAFIIAYVQFAADAASLAQFTDDRKVLATLLAEVQQMRRLMMPHGPAARDVYYFDLAEAQLRGDGYVKREATVRAQIAALVPGEPCECYGHYMEILMAGGLYEEAEAYRRRVVSDHPGNSFYTLMARGSIVRLRDGPFMARDIMKQTLVEFPNDIAVLSGTVTVLAQTGEFDEAQKYLEHLESVDRDGLWAYSAKLVLQTLRGDLKPRSSKLKAALDDARAIPITDGIVLFTLGDVPGGVDAWSRLTSESFLTLAGYKAYIETTFPDTVLKDPRYKALMERLGIGESWTAQLRRNVATLAPITGIHARGANKPSQVAARPGTPPAS